MVEDEQVLSEMVARYLGRAGFRVTQTGSGLVAVEIAREADPDVVVLDLGLPGLEGLEVCRRIREFSDCYILMLTARGTEEDRITGLSIGADDYITKPFSIRELVTRVHAVLRRPRRAQPGAHTESRSEAHPRIEPGTGALQIDPLAHQVLVSGTAVDLTRTEFDLLAVLASRPGQVFSRRELVTEVWNTTWVGDERIVDVHIGNLRRKLRTAAETAGADATTEFIGTVRGLGYRMAHA